MNSLRRNLPELLNNNKSLGAGEALSEEALSGVKLIQLKGDKFGALNGMRVPVDVANDLESLSASLFGYDNKFLNFYQKYLNTWKKSVTVFNPRSHVNNIISNVALMTLGGFPAHRALTFILSSNLTLGGLDKVHKLQAKALSGSLTPNESRALTKLMNKKSIQTAMSAERNGLFGGGSRFSELSQNTRNADDYVKPKKSIFKRMATPISWTNEKMTNAFQREDYAARLSMYDFLVNKKGFEPQAAIKEIDKIVPDYNKPMPKWAKALRDTGVVPFISWTYYVLPTMFRQLNPFGRNRVGGGLNRFNAFNTLKVVGAIYMLDKFLTPETDILDNQPPLFNARRMPISENRKGDVRTLKIDNWIPHIELIDLPEFFLGLAGSGIPQKAVTNILLDSDPFFRNKITENEGLQGIADRAEYYVKNYIPLPAYMYGVADTIKDYALTEEERKKNPFLLPRTLPERIATELGFNTLSYNKRDWNNYNKYGKWPRDKRYRDYRDIDRD